MLLGLHSVVLRRLSAVLEAQDLARVQIRRQGPECRIRTLGGNLETPVVSRQELLVMPAAILLASINAAHLLAGDVAVSGDYYDSACVASLLFDLNPVRNGVVHPEADIVTASPKRAVVWGRFLSVVLRRRGLNDDGPHDIDIITVQVAPSS